MDYTNNPAELLAATAAEVRVAELSRLGDRLSTRIKDADTSTAELLRAEVTRLYGVAFEITSALARGDLGKARLLSIGHDVEATSLAVVV